MEYCGGGSMQDIYHGMRLSGIFSVCSPNLNEALVTGCLSCVSKYHFYFCCELHQDMLTILYL